MTKIITAIAITIAISGCAASGQLAAVQGIATQVGQSPSQICSAIIGQDAANLTALKAQLNGTPPVQ